MTVATFFSSLVKIVTVAEEWSDMLRGRSFQPRDQGCHNDPNSLERGRQADGAEKARPFDAPLRPAAVQCPYQP